MSKQPHQKCFSCITQFQIIQDRKIGCGSFGTVKLARHKNTCRMYALKIINLKEIPSDTEMKLVEREIKLHKELDHPHIIKLWDSIIDGQHIYMVMEYAEMGNLFYHQNTKNVFSEVQAFKFFCQTLNGVHYLHSNNMIHRDLKPQNLLLDSLNNIKICDFGWCAQDIKSKRSTFCGTYQYMAPQMLFKSQYDYRVDIWALGVLLYELLHGCAPFKGKNATQVQRDMLKGSYYVAQHLSKNVTDLIYHILQFQLEKRYSIHQIFAHKWVKEMQYYIDSTLNSDNVVYPKDIQDKISQIPPITHKKIKFMHNQASKHLKNNSLGFEQSRRNININLQINNYAFERKNIKKIKNNQNQMYKIKQMQELISSKEAVYNYKGESVRNVKMQTMCKTQVNEGQVQVRVSDGMKSCKSYQTIKQFPSFQRERNKIKQKASHMSGDLLNAKKKYKQRKSQIDLNHQKYPFRLNTQTNQKQEWYERTKLKKCNIKTKMGIISSSSKLIRVNNKGKKVT